MIGLLGRRLLVVAAHPDDEVLGCGGLIAANAAAGGESAVLVVSEGTAAQSAYRDEAMQRKRDGQLRQAGAILKAAQVEHWDYPDMRLEEVPHLELNAAIQRFVFDGGYDVVLTHHPADLNRDHAVVHSSVLVACRPTPTCPVQALLTFHINSSTEWGFAPAGSRFTPNVYLDISEQLERKLQALSVYEDELREPPHPRSLDAVRDRARTYGSEVGVQAAEAFQLVYCREGVSGDNRMESATGFGEVGEPADLT